MRLVRLVAVLAIALALSATGLSTASAGGSTGAPRPPEIGRLGPITWTHGGTAHVVGTYRCWGDSQLMHLWVSVKQGGPDPTAGGSSRTVRAWYDTNISQDVAVVCDGRWHLRKVELGRHPVANYPTDAEDAAPTRPLGYLHDGRAWLQFCLVPIDPAHPDAEPTNLASKSRWVRVVGAHHR